MKWLGVSTPSYIKKRASGLRLRTESHAAKGTGLRLMPGSVAKEGRISADCKAGKHKHCSMLKCQCECNHGMEAA